LFDSVAPIESRSYLVAGNHFCALPSNFCVCCLTGFRARAIIRAVRKDELLAELDAARAALNQALAGLSPEDMLAAGAVGIWSVKDTLAHLVAWESEVVTALNHVQNKRKPAILKIEDFDEWNDEQYRANVRRPLAAILDDYEGVHRMLRKMIADYDLASLTDGRRFAWMESEPLWTLVEENVVLHEREHAEDILLWHNNQTK